MTAPQVFDLDEDDDVVIVGAGFIGCEVAATLRGQGVEQVTLVETNTFAAARSTGKGVMLISVTNHPRQRPR